MGSRDGRGGVFVVRCSLFVVRCGLWVVGCRLGEGGGVGGHPACPYGEILILTTHKPLPSHPTPFPSRVTILRFYDFTGEGAGWGQFISTCLHIFPRVSTPSPISHPHPNLFPCVSTYFHMFQPPPPSHTRPPTLISICFNNLSRPPRSYRAPTVRIKLGRSRKLHPSIRGRVHLPGAPDLAIPSQELTCDGGALPFASPLPKKDCPARSEHGSRNHDLYFHTYRHIQEEDVPGHLCWSGPFGKTGLAITACSTNSSLVH